VYTIFEHMKTETFWFT